MRLTIERIDRTPIELPFRDVPQRNMDRELPHWRYFEIIEIELSDGSIGHGETMLFYTWGETTDEDIERAEGANATELMWDDSLGSGLQIALFDAIGCSLGVPVHELLGDQVYNKTPVSWWCIEMSPEDWVTEAERAVDLGYTNLKVKGRPWFDIREQFKALDNNLPRWFSVDVDFNATLLNAKRALPVLEDLQTFTQLSHIEEPIPQENIKGSKCLVETLKTPIVFHYGRPEPLTAIQKQVCNGFVVNGGASSIRDTAAVAEMADTPFWLQLVGTGITATYSLHFGAVSEQATWPAINCHQLYEHNLLVDSIAVEDGYAPIPDKPGLGHEIDMDAVERFQCEKPSERPNPPRLIESNWPDGPTLYYAEAGVNFMIDSAMDEEIPYFKRGCDTRLVRDDGSDRWQELHDNATDEPVIVDEPIL